VSAREELFRRVASSFVDEERANKLIDAYRSEVLQEEARNLRRFENEMPEAGRKKNGDGILRAALILQERAETSS
jgi:hypothetical protein